MKFACISDTHGFHERLTDRIIQENPDVLIHAGDQTMRGYDSEVRNFYDWLKYLPVKYKVFIAGNHDFFYENHPRIIQQYLKEKFENELNNTVFYLENNACIIDGVVIHGSPITPWYHDWAFNRARGEQIKRYWDNIPNDVDILVTHGPPHGILDLTLTTQENVGCEDLLERVKELNNYNLRHHVFGHIHEEAGMKRIGNICFVNASSLDFNYKPVCDPICFHLVKN